MTNKSKRTPSVWALVDVVFTILAVVLIHSITLGPGGLIDEPDLPGGAVVLATEPPDHLLTLVEAGDETVVALNGSIRSLEDLEQALAAIPMTSTLWLEVHGRAHYEVVCDVESLLARYHPVYAERRSFSTGSKGNG